MKNIFEQLDALLDTIILNPDAWLSRLQNIRNRADAAYDEGSMSWQQWQALVTRSARIQDSINIRLAT